jgi:hypothetical protein
LCKASNIACLQENIGNQQVCHFVIPALFYVKNGNAEVWWNDGIKMAITEHDIHSSYADSIFGGHICPISRGSILHSINVILRMNMLFPTFPILITAIALFSGALPQAKTARLVSNS